MAKNNTQKLLKSLVYIAIEKNYYVEIRNHKYHTFLSSMEKTEIWNKYKSASKGYLFMYKTVDGKRSFSASAVASFEFDITKDMLKTYATNDSSQYYLDQAEFLSSIHNR